MTTSNLKKPGRIVKRARDEGRWQDKRMLKSDINPQILSLLQRMRAVENLVQDSLQNAITNPGPASPTCWMNNGSGGTLSEGDVVVIDQVTARSVNTTTTANDPRPAAVVVSLGPVAASSDVEVRFLGICDANVDADIAAVAKGDALTTSTTSKHLQKAESDADNIVAIATEALASGQDTILVFMIPSFKREGLVLETLTADNAGQVTLTHEPYSDSDGPNVLIYDLANYRISFASEWGAAGQWGGVSPDRACLSAAGAVVTNALSDFDTGANKLYAFYLRDDCYSVTSAAAFSAFLKSEMFMLSRAETGYFDIKFNALRTTEKEWIDAINELADEVRHIVRWTYHYDADGSLTGYSGFLRSILGYWSASSVITFRHYFYSYDTSAEVADAYFSQYDISGNFVFKASVAVTHIAHKVSQLVEELS